MAGIADPRNARVERVSPGFDLVRAPSGVQAGDMVVMFVSSAEEMDHVAVSGGNPWTEIGASSDGDLHTVVFATVAGTATPTRYAVEVDGIGTSAIAGTLHLRGATPAGILAVVDSGGISANSLPCPDASPGAAGGVEVRYALGYSGQFDVLFGFGQMPTEGQATTGDIGAYLGARTSLSSQGLPTRRINLLGSIVTVWQTWTLVIQPGDYVPPPPPVPAFTQGAGTALYRYTAHDLMTGTYIDDIYPADVAYDRRILEPGRFSGTLHVPNTEVAAAVRRIIPRHKSDLSTGPGRVEIRIWRDGELCGRYWLHGATLTRGRDGKIAWELRGSSLDATWYSVRIRDDRVYQSDQVANIRSLLQHCQSRPGAFAGISFQPGTSGVNSTFVATTDDNTSYGRAAAEEARTDDGFEWYVVDRVGPSGVESEWVWGAPTIDTGAVHIITQSPEGGDIAEYSLDIDALTGAGTDVEVRGGTPEVDDATEDAFPVYSSVISTGHRAAGWPRIDRLIDHPRQSTSVGRLTAYARYWAKKAGGALWVRQLTVYLGKESSLTPYSLGDTVRQMVTDVWHERQDGGAGLDESERLIGIEIRPPQKGSGKEEAVLILETVEVPL